MKTYTFSQTTTLNPEALWAVLENLEAWPQWDLGLEKTQWTDRERRIFALTPKGGSAVTIRVSAYEKGRLWTDRTSFPLAAMEAEHLLTPLPDGGTEVTINIRVKGLLSGLWDKIVVSGIAGGMKEQTEAMIARARSVTMGA